MSCNFCLGKINRIFLAVLLALSMTSVSAQTWRELLPQARQIGQSEFRWFGFRIYHAALWSQYQPFHPDAAFAIALTYHRRISRERIVQSSIDEIKRLFGQKYSIENLKLWEKLMLQIFPDVEEGSQLIGVSLPKQGCRFYDKDHLLGEIHDPEFAQAFFSIWLDARSKDHRLRDDLEIK